MQQVLPAQRSGEGGSRPASFSPSVQEQLDKLQPAHEVQRSSLGTNAAASISNSAIQEYPYLPPANPIPSHILETRTPSPPVAYKLRGRSSSGRSLPKIWKLGHKQKDDSASTASGTNGNRKNSGEDDRASVATSLGTQAGLVSSRVPAGNQRFDRRPTTTSLGCRLCPVEHVHKGRAYRCDLWPDRARDARAGAARR